MYRKELAYYFSGPIAYIVIGLYLLTISLFLWVIPGQWNIIDSGYAQVDGLFELGPWLLMLLCPALTMRLFAEERQTGTWDVLLSKRIPLRRIVWSKFLAAWTLTVLALLPCIVHYFIVSTIAEPVGNVDGGQFAGSFAGLVCLSGVFTALGVAAGSFSKNQIVSFIAAVTLCFVLYWVTLKDHYVGISRGVIDLGDLLYFAALTVAAVWAGILVLNRLSHK